MKKRWTFSKEMEQGSHAGAELEAFVSCRHLTLIDFRKSMKKQYNLLFYRVDDSIISSADTDNVIG